MLTIKPDENMTEFSIMLILDSEVWEVYVSDVLDILDLDHQSMDQEEWEIITDCYMNDIDIMDCATRLNAFWDQVK